MKPIILYRRDHSRHVSDVAELEAIRDAGMDFTHSRTDHRILAGDRLVVARYCALPFGKELQNDLLAHDCALINSYRQHRFVADLGWWYEVLGPELTPCTWRWLEELPEKGPFVLKGETNSRKDRWRTHMYAETSCDARMVAGRLMEDSLISQQAIYIREFKQFAKHKDDLSGCPVSEEYRFFCLDGQVLSSGFYWSQHVEELGVHPTPPAAIDFVAKKVLPLLNGLVRFVAVDVALDIDGRWWVVELNDGQMSGLSENDPATMYAEMARVLS